MISVDFDRRLFNDYMARFPRRHAEAMNAALRSESYRLNQAIRQYARSQGQGTWRYAPITKYLRKGQGYGAWVARFTRYFVDTETHTAFAGFMGKKQTGWRQGLGSASSKMVRRFSPISGQFAASAARLSAGYTMFISGKQQRRMAARLLNPGAKPFRRVKTLKGATRKWNALHQAIPRAGFHRVPARPFAGPVLQQERDRSIRNLQALYLTKLGGARYSTNWASEWGNR